MEFNFRYPNGVQVPMIGTPQNPIRRFKGGIGALNCGGDCGCASCSGGSRALDGIASLGRASMRGMTLGAMDDGQVAFSMPRWFQIAYGIVGLAAGGAGIYHGYKRSGVGAAIGYGVLGFVFPVIAVSTFAIQGFARRKRR
jgi:hypothetical protein